MKKIPLTRGQFALVDNEDFKELSKHKWCVNKTGYGFRAETKVMGKMLKMHRMIMNAPTDLEVDHKNHDMLDNRRCNLRICTRSQNCQNRKPQKGGSSKYKGASWYKLYKKWRAQIRLNGHVRHIGYFTDEIAAAKAYDTKALELFGEFAYLNFPCK